MEACHDKTYEKRLRKIYFYHHGHFSVSQLSNFPISQSPLTSSHTHTYTKATDRGNLGQMPQIKPYQNSNSLDSISWTKRKCVNTL